MRDKGAAGLTKPLSTDLVDKLAGRFASGQSSVRRGEEHVSRHAQSAGEPRDAGRFFNRGALLAAVR